MVKRQMFLHVPQRVGRQVPDHAELGACLPPDRQGSGPGGPRRCSSSSQQVKDVFGNLIITAA